MRQKPIWVAHTPEYGQCWRYEDHAGHPRLLLLRAKRLSKRTGTPLRALVEEGLKHVLAEQRTNTKRYELPDRSVGDAGAVNPLESWSWQDLRDEIYAEPKER